MKNEQITSTGTANRAIWALEPIAMFTARSILFLEATSTATQCSAALPTIATTITPTKNSLRPIDSAASEIELTRISLITPTATPAMASAMTALRIDHGSPCSSASSSAAARPRPRLRVEQGAVRLQREQQAEPVGRPAARSPPPATGARPSCRSRRSPSPGAGSPLPSTSSKMAGTTSAATASSSISDCALAAVRSKYWRLWRSPPTSIDAPMTSRMLPRIEPTSEALTTSCRPLPSANSAMMISGALPKVTFSRPPMPGPGARGQLLGRAAHQRRGRDDAQRGGEEDRHGSRAGDVQRDRDRDQRARAGRASPPSWSESAAAPAATYRYFAQAWTLATSCPAFCRHWRYCALLPPEPCGVVVVPPARCRPPPTARRSGPTAGGRPWAPRSSGAGRGRL